MHPLLRALPLVSLALAGGLGAAVAAFVDLTPRIDERFFFASDSAAYREARALRQRYVSREVLVVTAHAPDIDNDTYRKRIAALTQRLERLSRVQSVISLTKGPENLKDARESPLWRRLLLMQDVPASNLILSVDDDQPRALVESVSRVLRQHARPDFTLTLAGVPYVVDSIGRNLEDDFRRFSIAAVVVFGVLIAIMFRSWAVLLGSLTACAVASALTLLLQQWLVGRIGLLTANTVTIAFVLTQSHIVFLTNNWRQLRLRYARPPDTLRRALQYTAAASAWCVVVALLGFASLLYVEAQPLRELGWGGAIATLSAVAAAYLVYPPFLLWAGPPGAPQTAPAGRPTALVIPSGRAAALMLLGALAVGAGAARLDSDPSLLEYFGRDSEVRRSLAAVDPHGGSNPLSLSVRRQDGARLDTDDSYKKMWALQRAFQDDPAVGTVISLPVLMAETERSALARLLPWNWLIDLLSRPSFDRVARGFVSRDRTQALFMMRMIETDRTERRTAIIARVERIAAEHGFEVTAFGGTFALQGRLADLVVYSLFEGLAGLLLAVAVIGLLVTRSWAAALAMTLCAATVPAVGLGLFGLGGVPLDIIATPGVNVALGVAVDSMIHFGAAWRRARMTRPVRLALAEAQRQQAGGIIAFSIVVIAGFAIFAASSFPPTQRFGLAVILGAATAGVMALWVFPGLLRPLDRTAPPRPSAATAR